jgi:probable rRNA maturation factor
MPPTCDVTVDWDVDQPQALDAAEVERLLTRGLAGEGQQGEWSFAVRFVADAEIGRLHEAFMGDPSPTDIITFPYDPEDGEQGGDIVISVETADRNAAEDGWATEQELRFLVLHGLLHVLGWDDATDADRSAMLTRQRELMGA